MRRLFCSGRLLYPSAQMVADLGYGEARYSTVTNFVAAIKTRDIKRIGWCIRLGEYPKELRLAAYPVGTDRIGIEGNTSQKIARTAVAGDWEYACVTYNVDAAAPGLDAQMEAYLMELTGLDSLQ